MAPEIAITQRFKTACTPPAPEHRTTWQAHQRAARDSLHYTQQIAGLLVGLGIDPHITGPVETLAVLWERLHPAARTLPDFDELDHVAQIAQATDPEAAAAHRQQILDAITSGPEPVAISATDRRFLEHADGTLEETMHLGTVPQETSPWWLAHLLQVPLPCTVAVHIAVGDRSRARNRQRTRWARLLAAVNYKQRRGQLVGSDEEDALAEAQQLDRELRSTVAATVYQVATYVSFRQLDGDHAAFGERLKTVAREFQSLTDARVLRGAFLNVQSYPCTLPIGVDALRATRTYAQRSIAHCSPLLSAACGCPEGLIAGFSDPGGTLVRLDPYDAKFQTYLTVVAGQGGSGKTVIVNKLLMSAIAQGMRGFIIDRSSIATGTRDQRAQGHYDRLLSLLLGSAKVHVGTGSHDVICPWDVADCADVAPAKIEFLLAFHALLIGNLVGQERQLTADEEGPLTTAIAAVYARCAKTGERPCQTLLVAELEGLAERAAGHANVAATIWALIARLAPYVNDGPLAHIADRQTTVAPDRPLTLFDIAGAPNRLIGALILTIVDHIEYAIHQTRGRYVRGELADMAPGPRSLHGLAWLARVGATPLEPLQLVLGCGRRRALDHVRRLSDAELLRRVTMTRGDGSLLLVTGAGARVAGLPAWSAPRSVAPTTWAHASACAWVSAWLQLRGRSWISEREVLDDEFWRCELRYQDRRGTVRVTHRPDLGVRTAAGPVAIEVELQRKSAARLRAICAMYAQLTEHDAPFGGVVYVCGRDDVAERVAAAADLVGLRVPALSVRTLHDVVAQTRAAAARLEDLVEGGES